MSEALCPEWIDITKNQIPKSFWKAFENGELRDERTWTAIRQFSINCEKRHAFEKQIRQEHSLSATEPISLPQRVPGDVLSSPDSPLGKQTVANIISDQRP
jgi:hypothetical protein